MGKKQLPILGELNTPGGAGEESCIHGLLQFSDRLADRGLADKKLVSGVRNIAGQGDRVEDTIEG